MHTLNKAGLYASIAIVAASLNVEAAPAVQKPQPANAKQTPRWTAPDFASVPKSKFSIQGNNPFNPQVKQVAAAPTSKPADPKIETEVFILNGITGPPTRSAMINGQTFLVGEQSELRLSNGSKVLVRCAEINDASAVIEVGGARRELRFRTGI